MAQLLLRSVLYLVCLLFFVLPIEGSPSGRSNAHDVQQAARMAAHRSSELATKSISACASHPQQIGCEPSESAAQVSFLDGPGAWVALAIAAAIAIASFFTFRSALKRRRLKHASTAPTATTPPPPATPTPGSSNETGWRPAPGGYSVGGGQNLVEDTQEEPISTDATEITGEVSKFSMLGGTNNQPMTWMFRLARFDNSSGQRLTEVSVEAGLLLEGKLEDGDKVTVTGEFVSGRFMARKILNRRNGATFETMTKPRGLVAAILVIPTFIVFTLLFFGSCAAVVYLVAHIAISLQKH